MKKALGSVALLTSVFAGSASTAFGEGLQARALPSSQGCPVQITARVLSHTSLRPLHSEKEPGSTLAVVLRGERVSQIERVKLTVVRSSSSTGITPASTRSDTERQKTFELRRSNISDGVLKGSVALDWTNIRFVRVDSIVYASEPAWYSTKEEYCVASPDGTQLLSSVR